MTTESKSTPRRYTLTVRFLSAGTGTNTTELLRFHSPRVRNQQRPVVRHELLLQLHSAVRIDVLRVICDKRLRDGLADSIDLGSVSTTLHTHPDVHDAERLLACNKNRLIDLETEDLRVQEGDRGAIDVNEATPFLGVRNSSCGLLFAESLDGLC